jgi:hypothetical protein
MLARYSSSIRTGCANERPSGSVRGAPGNRCPYRDRQVSSASSCRDSYNVGRVPANPLSVCPDVQAFAPLTIGSVIPIMNCVPHSSYPTSRPRRSVYWP